jgi:hypothetical protein
MKKPDDQVGENIITELKKAKLLSDVALEKIKEKLVAGTLSSADWKLTFETDRPKKEGAK